MTKKPFDHLLTDSDVGSKVKDESRREPSLGEAIRYNRHDYERAKFVLVGIPQDYGVARNNGRPGARHAPKRIRAALDKLPALVAANQGLILDLGDITVTSNLEETLLIQYRVVKQLLDDNKRVLILGGGNDISFPDLSAMSDTFGSIAALNIDSHFDVREGVQPTSGTPYRQAIENGKLDPDQFYEIGCKPETNSTKHQRYLELNGAHIVWLSSLRNQGIESAFEGILSSIKARSIFWGIDFDVVRSSDAPGVSASYPVGLTAEEICTIADLAGRDERTRMVEISEVNPVYDIDNRTSQLAAMFIARYLRSACDE